MTKQEANKWFDLACLFAAREIDERNQFAEFLRERSVETGDGFYSQIAHAFQIAPVIHALNAAPKKPRIWN